MALPAFFVEPEPPPFRVLVVVLKVQSAHGTDPGEAADHDS
jgi:hypothetical protein